MYTINFFTDQKNEVLFHLLNDPSDTVGRLILYKYATDQDISKHRNIIAKIAINYYISQTLDSAFLFK